MTLHILMLTSMTRVSILQFKNLFLLSLYHDDCVGKISDTIHQNETIFFKYYEVNLVRSYFNGKNHQL